MDIYFVNNNNSQVSNVTKLYSYKTKQKLTTR